MNTKHFIIGAMALVVLGVGSRTLQAQNALAPEELPLNEVTVAFYPGAAATPFKGGDADWNSKFNYAVGFGGDYTYWFNKTIGVSAGLKLTYMSNTQESEKFSTVFEGTLPVAGIAGGNTGVRLRSTTETVSETRTMSLVEIPIRLSLNFNDIYANIGVSLATAITNYGSHSYGETDYVMTELTTAGVMLPDVPVQLPDSRVGSTFQSEDISWPFHVMLAAEAGYRFRMDDRNAISLGLYGRYALTQNSPDGKNQPMTLSRNRVSTAQPSTTALVEKIGYTEFGLRIAYHYGVGEKKVVSPQE